MLIVSLVALGCGDGSPAASGGAATRARQTVSSFLTAAAGGDGTKACSYLTRSAADDLRQAVLPSALSKAPSRSARAAENADVRRRIRTCPGTVAAVTQAVGPERLREASAAIRKAPVDVDLSSDRSTSLGGEAWVVTDGGRRVDVLNGLVDLLP